MYPAPLRPFQQASRKHGQYHREVTRLDLLMEARQSESAREPVQACTGSVSSICIFIAAFYSLLAGSSAFRSMNVSERDSGLDHCWLHSAVTSAPTSCGHQRGEHQMLFR